MTSARTSAKTIIPRTTTKVLRMTTIEIKLSIKISIYCIDHHNHQIHDANYGINDISSSEGKRREGVRHTVRSERHLCRAMGYKGN